MRTYGDVTTYRSIAGFSPSALEQRLGYQAGRLASGYEVFALVEPISEHDFIWGDHTNYSGGWQKATDIDEYVQRVDLLRFALAKQQNFDERRSDAAFATFMAREVDKLNVRMGPDQIVKVRPTIGHDDRIFWLRQYPNSDIRGTPQWTIRKGREKMFTRIATVEAGGVLR